MDSKQYPWPAKATDDQIRLIVNKLEAELERRLRESRDTGTLWLSEAEALLKEDFGWPVSRLLDVLVPHAVLQESDLDIDPALPLSVGERVRIRRRRELRKTAFGIKDDSGPIWTVKPLGTQPSEVFLVSRVRGEECTCGSYHQTSAENCPVHDRQGRPYGGINQVVQITTLDGEVVRAKVSDIGYATEWLPYWYFIAIK